jgi:hypothetical protein
MSSSKFKRVASICCFGDLKCCFLPVKVGFNSDVFSFFDGSLWVFYWNIQQLNSVWTINIRSISIRLFFGNAKKLQMQLPPVVSATKWLIDGE